MWWRISLPLCFFRAACDFTNGLVYLWNGNKVAAGVSALAIIPMYGSLAKELGMSVDELMKIAEDAAKEYKMSSIDDIKALKGKLSLDGFVGVVKGKALVVKMGKVFAKGIKSIDGHVFTKHKYGAKLGGSEFLQGANIEAVIKEGYGKSGKKFIETTSGTIPSIKVEVDMGRQIGVTNNGKNANILRIIVDYDGNVISSYPVDSFSI